MTASMVPAVAQVFSFATFITINTTIRPIKYPTAVIPRKLQKLCFPHLTLNQKTVHSFRLPTYAFTS